MKYFSANRRSRNSDFHIILTHMINLILNITRPIEISYIHVCEEANQYYFFVILSAVFWKLHCCVSTYGNNCAWTWPS